MSPGTLRRFGRSSLGALAASLALVVPASADDAGGGPPPPLSAAPGELSFPAQPTGTQAEPRTIVLTNTTGQPLSVVGIRTFGDDVPAFPMVRSTCSAPLAPGATCEMGVGFDPQREGEQRATLEVTSDAGGAPTTVALVGAGGPPMAEVSAQGAAQLSAALTMMLAGVRPSLAALGKAAHRLSGTLPVGGTLTVRFWQSGAAGRRGVVLASGIATLPAAGPIAVVVRPTRRGRALLAAGKAVRIEAEARFRPPSGADVAVNWIATVKKRG